MTRPARMTVSSQRPSTGMWTPDDFLRWFGLVVVGAAMVVGGYWMASGRGHTNSQIGPASLAVGGVIVASMAHVLWVLRGRRAVGERCDTLADVEWIEAVVAPVGADGPARSEGSVGLVAGSSSKLFHRSTCPMVDGRDWPESTRTDHGLAGRRPCRICSP